MEKIPSQEPEKETDDPGRTLADILRADDETYERSQRALRSLSGRLKESYLGQWVGVRHRYARKDNEELEPIVERAATEDELLDKLWRQYPKTAKLFAIAHVSQYLFSPRV